MTQTDMDIIQAALERIIKETGWHGSGPDGINYYYCEHCLEPGTEIQFINHTQQCLIHDIKHALTVCHKPRFYDREEIKNGTE